MHSDIRGMIDLGGPDPDRWGEAMVTLCDLAEVLVHTGHEDLIPREWGYRHSPVCQGIDGDNGFPHDSRAMPSDLVHAGNVLHRYVRALERVGHAY